MKGFLLGLVVALGAFAGYHYWKDFIHPPVAKSPSTADAGAPAKEGRDRKKKRRRGAVRVARNEWAPGPAAAPGAGAARPAAPAPTTDEPEPVKPSSADLKLVSQGDDPSRPDVVHLSDATDDSGSHELTQDDIDARFHAKEDSAASRAPARTRRPACRGA